MDDQYERIIIKSSDLHNACMVLENADIDYEIL